MSFYIEATKLIRFPSIDGDKATAEVIINSFFNIGINELSQGKPCFINFTKKLLELKVPTYFEPRDIVVEILEDVPRTMELIRICKNLRKHGYTIALDDFIIDEENPFLAELFKYIDIIKVDMLNTSVSMRHRIETVAKSNNIKLLAEKVETREEFEQARERGYDYFQGYFFSKPVILSSHDIPSYFHSYYEIMQMLSEKEPDIQAIAQLIESDLSLSFKLLKLINSPAIRTKNKVHSITQAIVLLGLIEIRKWVYVLAVRDTPVKQSEKSKELMQTCLIRGKMCESLGKLFNSSSSNSGYFMTGIFSLMDCIMGIPMEKILNDLPLSDDICNALKGENNHYKQVLNLVAAAENGDWETVHQLCKTFQIEESEVYQIYKEALLWSNHLMN
ncbi:EAL and HDOD domain-containing protein [Siminovitchia acidinfaciens]|uniref:EAL and HDOD domain-containing protein n=1 Tax=Siminovitchia acidinfaciens TaxID=2321395 RepID=UPI001F1BC055|nr:HDOD domain-containing protein [Siminovitchia acidinfaciens]